MAIRNLTWNGMKLFRTPRAAAKHAVANTLNPFNVRVLLDGKLEAPMQFEIDELWREIHALPLRKELK